MHNFNNLTHQLTLLGLSQAVAQEFCSFLQKCGLTNEDIEKLNKYSLKWAWLFAIEMYLKQGPVILNYVCIVLRASTKDVKDLDLFFSMQEFLNCPTNNKAIELRDKINNGLPKDVLEDFYNVIHKLQRNLYINTF